MFNSLESKFKLSLGLAIISFLGTYLSSEEVYSENLLRKYKDKEFSLQENMQKKIYELHFDLNSDGFYEGVFMAFDLNKKPWKKERIESVGYFKYSGEGTGPLEDKATLFYTFDEGNLGKVNGGLIDSNGDKKLDTPLNKIATKCLLLDLRNKSKKYQRRTKKNKSLLEKI